MTRKSKRTFTLLEVMVSFLTILLCFYPLIFPHSAILKSQRMFIDRVELDHTVSLIYADILERLYLNRFTWDEIRNKTSFDVDQELLKRIGSQSLPYKGTYQLEIEKSKPKITKDGKEEEQPKFFVHSIKIKMNFKYNYDKSNENKGIDYEYNVTIIQDVEHGRGLKAPE